MNRRELEQAMERTLNEIEDVKRRIATTTDPQERQQLIRKKKELQYLQLWHMDLYENHNSQ
jgi:hypothetical protein